MQVDAWLCIYYNNHKKQSTFTWLIWHYRSRQSTTVYYVAIITTNRPCKGWIFRIKIIPFIVIWGIKIQRSNSVFLLSPSAPRIERRCLSVVQLALTARVSIASANILTKQIIHKLHTTQRAMIGVLLTDRKRKDIFSLGRERKLLRF